MENNKMDDDGINPAALGALLKGDIENFMVTLTPGGIEAQEAQGQQTLVNSTNFPKNPNSYSSVNKEDSWDYLKSLGFEILEEIDDLFCEVNMPEGWTKEATDHSMWSYVLDANGVKRLSIFYKAAFYDRDAFFNFCYRYIIETNYLEDEDHSRSYKIIDNSIKETLFESSIVTLDQNGDSREEAEEWLKEHFPNYDDFKAYWE